MSPAAPTAQAHESVPKLVMLDYDGVIVDSLEVTCRITAQVLEEYGFLHLTTADQIMGFLKTNWYEALAQAGVPDAVVRTVDDVIERTALQEAQLTPPVDGMLEVLRTLVRRHTVAIVTSARTSSVSAFLERYAITPVAEVLGSDKGTSKVHKIAWLMRRFPCNSEQWLVTDTVGDVREAKEAGVRIIGVAWGWHPAEKLSEAGADCIAYSPADLLSFL